MSNNFLNFYNFTEDPFKLTPDIEYYFLSDTHQEVLMSLSYAYETGEGFIVIIGKPGTGKTITIRKFLDEYSNEKIETAYILFPNLSPEELLKAIIEDFGIKIEENISKNKIFSILKDFLIQKKSQGKKIFIIVDEAQGMPIESLEELRILSNLETEKEKLIQIILLGQPELEEKLNNPKLEQLKQRITLFIKLRPLNENEVQQYINFRLSKAGNHSVVIEPKAIKKVYKISKGNPRIINQIMERALMAGFVEGTKYITSKHIQKAVESLKLVNQKAPDRTIYKLAAIVLVLGTVISITGYMLLKQNTEISSQITIPQEQPNKQQKYYIMYFATTANIEEAKRLKKIFEEKTNKNFNLLKVKDGKYYAVARLYQTKEEAKKELKELRELTGKEDAFITNEMYSPEIIE